MSDTSDDMETGSALLEGYLEELEEKIARKEWTTKAGTTLKIKQMNDNHLNHSINLMMRRIEGCSEIFIDYYERILGNLREEKKRRSVNWGDLCF